MQKCKETFFCLVTPFQLAPTNRYSYFIKMKTSLFREAFKEKSLTFVKPPLTLESNTTKSKKIYTIVEIRN